METCASSARRIYITLSVFAELVFRSQLLIFAACHLMQVLDLQLSIENLAAWSDRLNRRITLQDICLQPLYPDNKKCAIMSILNYFQNNATHLDYDRYDDYHFYVEADYLKHFAICSRYLPCV